MRHLAAALLVAVVVTAACNDTISDLQVLEIHPAEGPNRTALPVEIIGNFQGIPHSNFNDPEKAHSNVNFQATLGNTSLQDVTFRARTRLEAAVPAGMTPGTYDLVVRDPEGRSATLVNAFRVLGPTDAAADRRDLGPPGDGPGPVPDQSQPDMPALPDAFVCPPVCTNNCAGGICKLNCSNGCTCPAGIACEVSCGSASCSGDIDCRQALSCTIDCNSSSCANWIRCGTGACSITCDGDSCKGDIQCAGPCTIKCTNSACQNAVTCSGGPCVISCDGASCQSINCSQACSCSTSCTNGSCSGGVTCPAGCKSGGNCVTSPASTCDTC